MREHARLLVPRGRARTVICLCAAAVALASVPARSATLPYGVLDHFDVCEANGDYASIDSIAVDPAYNIYVGARDGTVRLISSGGAPLGMISSGPSQPFEEPVVANGPAGVVYVADGYDPIQLAKYVVAGGNLQLAQTYVTNQGYYATTLGIRRVAGLVATQNRGLFVLDPTQGIVNLSDADSHFISLTLPGGSGRLVAITGTNNAIVTAATTDLEGPDWLAFYSGEPLSYIGQVSISESVEGIADGYDGSVWVLASANPGDPGIHGLQHFQAGTLLGTVPIPGGLNAIDTTSDGSIWIARDDGILRLGPGGATIPPDQFGHAPCGGPKVSDSLPPHFHFSRELDLLARCNEPCGLVASGKLTVPGSRKTYTLSGPARYSATGGPVRLQLRVPSSALKALSRALAHHHKATVQVSIAAVDGGDVRNYFQQRLTLG